MPEPSSPRALLSAFVILLTGALAGFDLWLYRGLLLPLLPYPFRPPDEHLLLTTRTADLPGFVVLGIGLAGAAHALHVRAARRPGHEPSSRFGAAAGLAPLCLLALPPLALALVASPLRAHAGPWLFLGFDLRWWLLAGVALLVLAGTGPAARVRAWERRWTRLLWSDVTLAAVLLAAALTASPQFRFDGWLGGDEPKYVRFMENLYRGRGFDIEGLALINALPADSGSCLSCNLVHLARATRALGEDLVVDLQWLLGRDVSPPPRSTHGADVFLPGKRGGVYQGHNPGLAFVLLPAYAIDRSWLDGGQGSHGEFPAHLYATGTAVLLIYILWSAAVFRFLRRWSGQRALSWALTVVAMVSQPVAAFSYQYYPEVVAGFFIFAIARYTVFSGSPRVMPALLYGLATGFLFWLHVRFAALAVVLAAAALFWPGRTHRARVWFGAGLIVPLAALLLYDYHVSGTPLPLLMLDEQPLFSVARVGRALTGYWLDRNWGLVAYAPVFVLALPGICLAARRRPLPSLMLAALVVALALPSAAHGWKGGISTPMRLVVALVPLGMIAVAEAWRAFQGSRWFVAALGLLAAVSVHNGLLFNGTHQRHRPEMIGPGWSGWNVALVLPDLDDPGWLTSPHLILWAVISISLIVATLRLRERHVLVEERRPSWMAAATVAILAFGGLGSAATTLGGTDARADVLVEPRPPRDEALMFYMAHRDGLALSSTEGRVQVPKRFPNPVEIELHVIVSPNPAPAGSAVHLRIDATGPNGETAWGLAAIDFGDGSPVHTVHIVGRVTADHVFARDGQYSVRVGIEPAGMGGLDRRTTVEVRSPTSP